MEAAHTTLIIFGASGDLTARKLVPSLYRLARKNRLPEGLTVVGVARSDLGDEGFRQLMAEAVREHAERAWSEEAWNAFAERLFYVAADAMQLADVEKLRDWLQEHEGDNGGARLYYLSVSPKLYEGIVTNLGEAGMCREEGHWRRLIIEKPFGTNLKSAQELNTLVRERFRERQLYRIDHYLGKDTVQNILAMRFANILFEPLWNHRYIDHVQITVSESVTVEGRGGYYDKAGVLRDMFQNHLLQLLALVAMEAPARFAADTLRNEKVKVLDAIAPLSVADAAQHIVCGQYEGYRSEEGVEPGTRTPTFAAVRLQIDNWRWHGVPFYLRSGKAMGGRSSEVIVQFRCPPHLMFPLPPGKTLESNQLALLIQPDAGIHLSFQSKVPDHEGMRLQKSDLEFHFGGPGGGSTIPEAYERLLLDALNGDAALFMRNDEIERAWEIIDPFIAASEEDDSVLPELYRIGSSGPPGAAAFLKKDGRRWATHSQQGR